MKRFFFCIAIVGFCVIPVAAQNTQLNPQQEQQQAPPQSNAQARPQSQQPPPQQQAPPQSNAQARPQSQQRAQPAQQPNATTPQPPPAHPQAQEQQPGTQAQTQPPPQTNSQYQSEQQPPEVSRRAPHRIWEPQHQAWKGAEEELQNGDLYRIVIAGTTNAADFQANPGKIKIRLQSTPLLPSAKGSAKIDSKQIGATSINVSLKGLESPRRFQHRDVTYVLWAVSPDGEPNNLGELVVHHGKAKLHATTRLPAFAVIVTAEPDFAVTVPSDVVVLQDQIRHEKKLPLTRVNASYLLMPHKEYTYTPAAFEEGSHRKHSKVPLALDEARNALQLARQANAETYAPDVFSKAQTELTAANNQLFNGKHKKMAIAQARQAVQTAEDARLIAQKHEVLEAVEVQP